MRTSPRVGPAQARPAPRPVRSGHCRRRRRCRRSRRARTVKRRAVDQRLRPPGDATVSPSTSSSGAPGARRAALRCCRSTLRPVIARTISPAVVSLVFMRADDAAVAQHGHAVGDRHHLVELVRDEQDRAPLGGEPSHDGEQPVALAAASAPRSARRGSGCARRDRAPSGSRRAGARRPRARRPSASGSTCRPWRSRELGDLARAPRARSMKAPRRGSAPIDDVLPDGQRIEQLERLMHHAHAVRRSRRARERKRTSAPRSRMRPSSGRCRP